MIENRYKIKTKVQMPNACAQKKSTVLYSTCVYANLHEVEYVDIVQEHRLKMTYRFHPSVHYRLPVFRF